MLKPEEVFERIGREPGVRSVVDRFYDIMDSLPEAAIIRALHPADLSASRDKLYWFLVGWLGGPQLYVERFGHPRLRARHLPFPIGTAERDAWLLCMQQSLLATVPDEEINTFMMRTLASVADHMRNTPD
ncbi:MAG: group II truncated hemoglobin [Deltaproteobacteria bacterium]|nr:group II truncated hemoglobin [Deltaproteobacteria bacterium]